MRAYSIRLMVIGACILSLTTVVFERHVSATSIQLVPLEKLTRSSSHVVQGKVTKVESLWNKDRTAIYTRVTLARQQVLKGQDMPEEVAVFLPGGTVDGRTTFVIGAPEFKEGQEAILFLNQATDYQDEVALPAKVIPFRLTDVFQGMFNVIVDPATDRKIAVSNAVKLVVQPVAEPSALPPGGLEGLPLTDLHTRIREIRSRTLKEDLK